MTKNQEIAEIIRQQVGRSSLYLLGAYNFVAVEKGLSFRIRGSKKVNYVKIVLTPLDEYQVEFGKIWGINYKQIHTHDSVYVENLHGLLEQETGLVTSF